MRVTIVSHIPKLSEKYFPNQTVVYQRFKQKLNLVKLLLKQVTLISIQKKSFFILSFYKVIKLDVFRGDFFCFCKISFNF